MALFCDNCNIDVTKYVEMRVPRCPNCNYSLLATTTIQKKQFKNAEQRAYEILANNHHARNDDWDFINAYQSRFGRIDSPTTAIRWREKLQNPRSGKKECFPTSTTRLQRRNCQVNHGHAWGGQTIRSDQLAEYSEVEDG